MWIVFLCKRVSRKTRVIFSTSFFTSYAHAQKNIHRATSKQKETTSDCYWLSKGVFGLPFDQKLLRKDSNSHKAFLLFTNCELLRLKAITFVIWRVVSSKYKLNKLNAEFFVFVVRWNDLSSDFVSLNMACANFK